jgi:hypothetical protein
MKYYKTTLFNQGPPINMEDTEVVYLESTDPAELLTTALDTHSKPVKEWEEVTKDVYDSNVE